MMFPVAHWGKKGLLLDQVPGAVAAYSSRKLRTAYAGSALRVRRFSDNAEQDIGFSAGLLDTAALVAFVSGGGGYVSKWYDQSGGGNDLIQTTASSQPQVAASGAVLVGPNSRPKLDFNGSLWLGVATSTTNLDFEKTSPFTSMGAVKISNLSADRFFIAKDRASGANGGWYTHAQSSTSRFRFTLQDTSGPAIVMQGSTAVSTSANYLVTSINDGTATPAGMTLRVNGTAESMTTVQTGLSGSIKNVAPFCVGSRESGNVALVGSMMEVIIWPSALTGGLLATAEASAKAYFAL